MDDTPTTFRYLGYSPNRWKYLVVDATSPIEFRAINADYKKGICGDVENCALSRALRRYNSGVLRVYTGASFAYVVFKIAPYTAVRYEVPDSHRDAIVAFDKTGYLSAGIYRFKVPSPSHRIGYKIGSSGTNNRGGVVKEISQNNTIKRSAPTRKVTNK